MTENEWTQSICEKLKNDLKRHSLHADTLQKIPYLQEIAGYNEEWKPEYATPSSFETDLVVY